MRLRFLLAKEFVQFRRNPVLLRMAIIIPIVQTTLLALAANLDLTEVPVAVWDEDRSFESRDLVRRIDATPYFEVRAWHLDDEALDRDLATGDAQVAIHLPPGFARDLARAEATLQVRVDGTDSMTAGVAVVYVQQIALAYDQRLRLEELDRRGMKLTVPSVDIRSRVFYNPDLRSLWYMAPAVMALVLTVMMQNLTALSIARERELGTLEQLVMTPLRIGELLLAKLVPFFLVGCLDAILVSLAVTQVFGVPLRGSIPTLALAVVCFLFAVLGLGLFVSASSANQQQAQLMNFFLSFPAMLLSGFIFPIENLPAPLQPISAVVPMSYFLEVIRGVFLRGAGFAELSRELLAMAVLAALYFSLGALRFHKRLD